MKSRTLLLVLGLMFPAFLSAAQPDPITENIIRRAFLEVLEREPDPSGLETYTRALREEGRDERWLREVLAASEEALQIRRRRAQSRQEILKTAGLWFVLFLACALVGGTLLQFLAPPRPNDLGPGCFVSFWTGFGTLLTLGFFWSLFLPVNSVPFLLFCGLAAGCAAHRLRYRFRNKTVPGKTNLVPVITFAALGISLVCIALVSSLSNRFDAYDTLLYHWSAVRWLKTHPAVPGLANLHIRLGTNSAWLLLAAILDHGPFEGRTAWILPGFFPAVCGLHLLHTLMFEPKLRARIFALLLLPHVVETSYRASPGLYFDIPAQLALFAAAVEFLKTSFPFQSIKTDTRPAGRLLAFVAPATVAFVIKPIGAPLLFFAGLGLFLHSIRVCRKAPIATSSALAIPGLLLCGWMARNAVLTGWILFPAAIGPLPVDWRVPVDSHESTHPHMMQSVKGQSEVIRAWARNPGPDFEEALGAPTRAWVPAWWHRNKHRTPIKRMLPTGIALTILWTSLLQTKRKLEVGEIFLVALLYGQLLFWFHMAPDLRFGQLLFAFPIAWSGSGLLALVPWLDKGWSRILFVLMAAAVLAGPLAEAIPRSRGARMGSPWAGETKLRTLENGQYPPLQIYVPTRGDQTGDAPLPASPYYHHSLLAREPGNLRAGFRLKK